MSDYRVTLPNGTTVEGSEFVDVCRMAVAFDERRMAEELGLLPEWNAYQEESDTNDVWQEFSERP